MKALKIGLAALLSMAFSIACAKGPAANENKGTQGQANVSAVAPANVNGSHSQAAPQSGQTANGNTNNAKTEEPKADSQAKPISNVNAAELYARLTCVACHGNDGKGRIPNARDFTSPEWQRQISDAAIAGAIKQGRPPLMPAYADRISEEETRALVAYVRGFGK